MKYLKLYESFVVRFWGKKADDIGCDSSYVATNDIEETLREICLELEDCGYEITINVAEDYKTIVINKEKDIIISKDEWLNIIEYLLRIKDYLGDRYLSCKVYNKSSGWELFNLKEDYKKKNILSIIKDEFKQKKSIITIKIEYA